MLLKVSFLTHSPVKDHADFLPEFVVDGTKIPDVDVCLFQCQRE